MRGVGVGEEVGHYGGLSDDLAVVDERGHEAARVDLEVFRCARLREVDDLLLEWDAQLREGDVCAVSPWSRVLGRTQYNRIV